MRKEVGRRDKGVMGSNDDRWDHPLTWILPALDVPWVQVALAGVTQVNGVRGQGRFRGRSFTIWRLGPSGFFGGVGEVYNEDDMLLKSLGSDVYVAKTSNLNS